MLQRLGKAGVLKTASDTLLKAKTTKSTEVPQLTISRAQVHELISLLEPFEKATHALQGDGSHYDGVTISRVIPALIEIDDSLASSKTQLPKPFNQNFILAYCCCCYTNALLRAISKDLIVAFIVFRDSFNVKSFTSFMLVIIITESWHLIDYLNHTPVHSSTFVCL
jgi:hypothetical protein